MEGRGVARSSLGRLGVVPACCLRGALARVGRRSVVFPFYSGCIPVVFRLYSGCTPVVRRLYVLYISRLGPSSSRGGIGRMTASLLIPWVI
jgi:hypothetical protein